VSSLEGKSLLLGDPRMERKIQRSQSPLWKLRHSLKMGIGSYPQKMGDAMGIFHGDTFK